MGCGIFQSLPSDETDLKEEDFTKLYVQKFHKHFLPEYFAGCFWEFCCNASEEKQVVAQQLKALSEYATESSSSSTSGASIVQESVDGKLPVAVSEVLQDVEVDQVLLQRKHNRKIGKNARIRVQIENKKCNKRDFTTLTEAEKAIRASYPYVQPQDAITLGNYLFGSSQLNLHQFIKLAFLFNPDTIRRWLEDKVCIFFFLVDHNFNDIVFTSQLKQVCAKFCLGENVDKVVDGVFKKCPAMMNKQQFDLQICSQLRRFEIKPFQIAVKYENVKFFKQKLQKQKQKRRELIGEQLEEVVQTTTLPPNRSQNELIKKFVEDSD